MCVMKVGTSVGTVSIWGESYGQQAQKDTILKKTNK